jgi:hypothetical protein
MSTMTLHLLSANEVSLFRFHSRCYFARYDPRMEVNCEILCEECIHPWEGGCLSLLSTAIKELRQQGLHNPNICIALTWIYMVHVFIHLTDCTLTCVQWNLTCNSVNIVQ